MPEPVTLICSFRRRGALKRDVGEGVTLVIEVPETDALRAMQVVSEYPETFYLTWTEKPPE